MGAICHGAYKPHQLSEILKSADVGLVLPVWNDNGSQVLMEFINNGIPSWEQPWAVCQIFAMKRVSIPSAARIEEHQNG
jgi:hypothetical protein